MSHRTIRLRGFVIFLKAYFAYAALLWLLIYWVDSQGATVMRTVL